ncbi:hypothetical protein NL533_35805, partial [Klebsiella pneumoniae]|nr:hypothetical protein [Klebsiella pneumoniae]
EEINFQARVLTSGGGLIPDGNYNIKFAIYSGGDGVLGGGDETLEWTGSHLNTNGDQVVVKNGYISARLGSSVAQTNT